MTNVPPKHVRFFSQNLPQRGGGPLPYVSSYFASPCQLPEKCWMTSQLCTCASVGILPDPDWCSLLRAVSYLRYGIKWPAKCSPPVSPRNSHFPTSKPPPNLITQTKNFASFFFFLFKKEKTQDILSIALFNNLAPPKSWALNTMSTVITSQSETLRHTTLPPQAITGKN